MITYGTELGSLGKQEPENRADMPWGTKHPAQEMIRTLTKLRTEHPVLKDGIGSVEQWEKDVLVYTQHLGSESSTLIINQKETPIPSPNSFTICFDITKKNGFSPCSSPEIEPQSIRLGIRDASPQTKRYIRTEIVVSSCAPENNLRIVGSSLEVGGWNPNNGIHLVYRGNNICQTSLLLPEDAVIRFKIVDVQEKKIQWGQGPDQILWNTESLQLTWTP